MPKDRARVLIVDDQTANLKLVSSLLSIYHCETADSGVAALAKLDAFLPDLILLDVLMPEMDGYQVCETIKSHPLHREIPVIMVTALNDRNAKIRGLEVGANEFLTKPIDSAELRLRAANLLKIREYGRLLSDHNKILQERLADRTKQLELAYGESITRLSMAAEYKDLDTGMHIRRIAEYTRILAELAGFSVAECGLLAQASPMHDIGKIGIPDSILLKPGPLSGEELDIMQSHTTIGGKILDKATSPLLQTACQIALGHHERWDGSGYPAGYAGDKIPVAARVVALVDQYDALRSKRPYKKPLSHDRTLKIILEGDGRTMPEHFDPHFLRIFAANHKIFQQIFQSLAD